MTAEEMVLQHWGFDSTTNPFDLSDTMRYELKAAVKLMHLWEEHKMKKVKADAAVYELLIHSREQMIVSRDKEIEDMQDNIRRINNMSEVSISDFTELIREADRLFETVGGSTRHYVSDCLLPLMEEKGMKLINT